MRMFRNDYSEGAAPEVLQALVKTNDEQWPGYTEEGDEHCGHARELIRQAVGRDDVNVEFCIGGTSANLIGVTGMLRDWEGVICTQDAHINVHETGAIAACGRTILPTQDEDGFLSELSCVDGGTVVAVGHVPVMRNMVGRLCGEDVPFGKGSVAAIDFPTGRLAAGQARLLWLREA